MQALKFIGLVVLSFLASVALCWVGMSVFGGEGESWSVIAWLMGGFVAFFACMIYHNPLA